MNAAVLRRIGGPLAIEDVAKPEPKENEVLVKVAACGVCHSDLHLVKGHTAFPLPVVLGHEVSGVVEKVVGHGSGLKGGDRVVCTVIMPCGSCHYCINGHEDLCETFYLLNRLKGVLYDGTTRIYDHNGQPIWMFSMGGMAEYAVVPSNAVFPLPDGISIGDSCVLGCAGLTAYGAVKNQARLRASQSVAVIGVGGVGSSIIQVAKVFGAAEIIAVDVREEKLEAAKLSGATDVVNAAQEETARRILELTDGKGVDVAFEATGRPETYVAALNSVKSGGSVVAVGLSSASTTIPIEINRFVRKGIRLLGSYGARPRQDMPELLDLVQRRIFDTTRSVTGRYGLRQVNEALGALERGEILGRSILEF
jgi:S-(hydroxymethyl)glutathione dehydrogenase/alcohol dehydrogenase